MIEELKDKEWTDIKYLRSRMTGNVGLALDQAYNIGFIEGEKTGKRNLVNELLEYINHRKDISDDKWVDYELRELEKKLKCIDETINEVSE